jgi:hypothetical protein
MKHASMTVILGMASAAVSTLSLAQAVPTTGTSAGAAPQGLEAFLAADLGRGVFRSGDQIARAWGTLGSGATPSESGKAFIDAHARGLYGVDPSQLAPIGPFEAAEHLVPIMPDRAVGGSRFTGTYWSQFVKGIPVYKSHLLVLVRNEPGFPAVLASSTLWDVSGIEASLDGIDPRVLPDARTWTRHALNQFRAQPQVGPAKYVIWAGIDRLRAEPRLAVQFVAEGGGHWDPDTHQRIEFVVDAKSGQVLHQHSLVCNAVEGRVTGSGTPGSGASICTSPDALPLQYLAVQVDGTTVYTDADGFYSAPDAAGTSAASASLLGRYFDVRDNGVPTLSLSASVPQGAGWSPLFNATDNGTTAFDGPRAQVNVYHHANVIRDAVLRSNADYPTIATQLAFRANVNIAATCNATYTGTAINFYAAGGGCSNTAFGTVVSHEYGHHAVATGGSLQGPYGEGMGDVFGIITSDESITGIGFRNCIGGIRDADNTCQYDPESCSSCGSTVHSCGRLLSGFVWDVRGELLASDPTGYRQYLADLAINSILLHGAVTTIDGAITIDFLTLDDDDASLSNGTPNEAAIVSAGSQHGLLPPGLISLDSAIPELVPPDMPVTIGFRVRSFAEPIVASSVRVLRSSNGQVTELVPTQVGIDTWSITFPGQACGASVRFSVRAQTAQGTVLQHPEGAPNAQLTMTFGTSVSTSEFAINDFEASTSDWSVGATGDNATSGLWVRGNPVGTAFGSGIPAQPEDDHTPSPGTSCWFTGQGAVGGTAGQADVDGGTTTLVSPNFALAGANDPRVEFWAWYSNEGGSSPYSDRMPVELSADGGATWVTALTIWENARAWVRREIRVEDFFPAPVAQVRVRFRASDLGSGSLVEAAIDDVRITTATVDCEPLTPADLNSDGVVDGADLGILLGNWGSAGAGDLDGSGTVDGIDLGLLLGSWS